MAKSTKKQSRKRKKSKSKDYCKAINIWALTVFICGQADRMTMQ